MQTAAVLDNHAITDLLISNGASVNFHGGFFGAALQAAAYHGHEEVLHMLLNHGTDPNAESGFLRSAFLAAACAGRINVAGNLLSYGADRYAPPDLLLIISADSDRIENMGRQLISTLGSLFGSEYPSTLASMAKLASEYRNQRRWKEAEELGLQVMELSIKGLG
jgi:hypothetical protein